MSKVSMMDTGGVTLGAKPGISRKAIMPPNDLWVVVRNGTAHDVDAALIMLRRNNGNIDARNSFGSTALHIAVWRNHVPIVKRLLAAGADADVRDGESGWSSLHRALHFGHLAIAGVLIEAGASVLLEDSKGRTPVDLLSGPLKQVVDDLNNAGGSEVFSWGNGANYQLGTGTAGIQKLPCRVDVLQGLNVIATAAAKFHSVALTADGKLYSWGFGRGGRLGHSDFDVHSGQAAVITPRLVSCGLGTRQVKSIAVAKHHTVVATNGGDVYTWGSNREGQLGYTSVDTQPTPRRVTSLKARVVAVAAANKHTAVLTDAGEVFTWGCNREGQLGYGTSNSASNYTPRAVEYLKGKIFSSVSAAKYHTVVLGLEGEVFTWGYKMVMPRRVLIARNTRKGGNVPLKFHQAERLHVVAIAAGTTHSTALSEDGLIFYWVSADPHLRCQQLLSMAGHHAVALAAGKYRTAVVTAVGNVYAWDGEKTNVDMPLVPFRIHGIKHATHISVGENHSLVIASVYMPKFPPQSPTETSVAVDGRAQEDGEEDLDMDEIRLDGPSEGTSHIEVVWQPCRVPSLKELCQKVMAQCIVEPKNALQLLEVADSLGAVDLRKHCEDLVLHNLDYLLTISPMAFAHVAPVLLAEVEKALDASSSQPWSNRRLPTPTAVFPAVVDSEEDEYEAGYVSRMRPLPFSSSISDVEKVTEGFLHQESEVDKAVVKQLRALRKKLQQIDELELQQARGHPLDDQQKTKLQKKQAIKDAIVALDSGSACKASEEEENLETSSGALEEGLQGKAIGTRRGLSARKKNSKLLVDHTMPEEFHQKKSKNGRTNKASNKKGQSTPDDQNKRSAKEVASPAVEEKVHFRKGGHAPATTNDIWNAGIDEVSEDSRSIVESVKQHGHVGIHGFVQVSDNTSQKCPQKATEQQPLPKKHSKKGGLSMFLSGALDEAPKLPSPGPVAPKVNGPAWGGVQRNVGLASLREIQSQQTAEADSASAEESSACTQFSSKFFKAKNLDGDGTKGVRIQAEIPEAVFYDSDTGGCRVSLSQFMRSSTPIAVKPLKAAKLACGENSDSNLTPWAGTSPVTSASSFKEIQMEQVKHKAQQRHSGTHSSPKPSSPISLLNFTATPSSSDRGVGEKVASRWYKPDTDSASSIRCIQIEEEAMKELRRIYKNVKVVRTNDL